MEQRTEHHQPEAVLSNLQKTPEKRLERLITEHNGKLANSFEEILGDGGVPSENADEIIKTVREWRDFSFNKNKN